MKKFKRLPRTHFPSRRMGSLVFLVTVLLSLSWALSTAKAGSWPDSTTLGSSDLLADLRGRFRQIPPKDEAFSPSSAPNLAPVPSVAVQTGSVLLGENFNITVTFENTGDETGYGPFIDLYIPHKGADGVFPDELTYDGISPASGSNYSATLDGETLNTVTQTFPDDGSGTGCVNHPWGLDENGIFLEVCGEAGDQLVSIELPYGSYTPGQPQLTVSLPAHLSQDANPGTPLTIRGRGGFIYGATPMVDWCCTTPVDTTLVSDSGTPDTWAPFSDVHPAVVDFSKSNNAGELATGPNNPAVYTISLEFAPGQSFFDLDITDILPNNLVYLGNLTTNPPADSITEPALDGQPHNGDTIDLHWDGPLDSDVTGEVTVSFDYYIPEFDADGAPIAPGTTVNQATLDQLWWDPSDPELPNQEISGGISAESTSTTAAPITLGKSRGIAVDTGTSGFTPGDVLAYTLTFEISDYFGFDNLSLEDVLPDGQHYYADGTYSPTLSITRDGATENYLFNPDNVFVDCNYTGGPGSECDADNDTGSPGQSTITFDIDQELEDQGANSQILGDLIDDGNPQADATTTGTIIFYAEMLDKYTDLYAAPDNYVKMGDSQTNTAEISGSQVDEDTCSPGPCTVTTTLSANTASAGITVGRGTVEKDIIAVDGSYCNAGNPCSDVAIGAGNTVTYRIQYDLLTGDYADLSFTDFLPLPIFHAEDPDNDGSSLSTWPEDTANLIPESGTWNLGPNDTRGNDPASVNVSPSTADNSIQFYFGDYDDLTNQASLIEIYFTATVTDEKFGDGLKMRNSVLQQDANSPGETSTSRSNVDLTLTEPVLVGEKSVVSTDHEGIEPDPAVPAPIVFADPGNSTAPWNTDETIDSDYLDAHSLNSGIEGIDAGDQVKFALVIENTGSGINGAFDITIRDHLPAGYIFPGTGLGGFNLQVYRGDGTPLIDGTGAGLEFLGTNNDARDFFENGIRLKDYQENPLFDSSYPEYGEGLCQAHDATSGENVIIVTYDLMVDPQVAPGTIIQNLGEITSYSSTEDGKNYIPEPEASSSESIIDNPELLKEFTGSEIDDSEGGSFNLDAEAVIGELITYRLTVTVPEGVSPNTLIVDTLDPGLAFDSQDSFLNSNPDTDPTGDTDDGISYTGSEVPVITGSGGTITWDLGTLSNTNNDDNTAETLTFEYTAVVLNTAGNQAGATLDNQVEMTWDTKDADGSTVTGSAGPVSGDSITVIEPQITTSKLVSPTSADAGDTVVFTVTVSNPASNSTTAYDVTWSDSLPSDLSYSAGTFGVGICDIAPDATSDAGPFTASWAQIDPGQSCDLTFQATVDYSASPGQLITNTAESAWTSLSGEVAGRDERTGADGVNGALNDYASQGTADINIDSTDHVKSILTTSEAHTGDPGDGTQRAVIGEIVRYRLVVRLPEGTSTNFQIRDYLPPGETFLNDGTAKAIFIANGTGITSSDYGTLPIPGITDATHPGCFLTGSSADGTSPAVPADCSPLGDHNIGSSSSTTTDSDSYSTGTDPFFKLGTLVNNDDDADSEYVVVEFNALVDNNSSNPNDAGDLRTDYFQVYINGSQIGSNSNSVSVRIAEPLLTAAKSLSTMPADGGDSLEYTLVITNPETGNNDASAFDLSLSDSFDGYISGLTLDTVTTTQAGTCLGGTAYSDSGSLTGSSLSFTASCLDPGETITLVLSGILDSEIPAGYDLENLAQLAWTSLPGAGTADNSTGSTIPGASGSETGERDDSGGVNDYADSDNANRTLDTPLISKTISPVEYTIGDLLTYNLLITLPEGITQDMVLIDNLPAGLEYVSHTLITSAAASGGLLSADFNGVFTNDPPTANSPSGSGTDLTLNFGDTDTDADNDPANDSFLVQVTARVLDISSNYDSVIRTNQGQVQYTNPNTGGTSTVSDSADITIIEPWITTAKTVTPTASVQAGDTLTYTVRFTNNGNSPAYEVTAEDLLPADVDYNSDASCEYFDGVSTSSINVTVSGTTTLSFGTWDIPVGHYLECQYSITTQADIELGASHENTVDADWSSQDGSPAGERIYDDGLTGPVDDGLQDQDSASFTTGTPTTLTKDDGGVTQAVIGDLIHITLTIDTPLGTLRSTTVEDLLPAGMVYVSGSQTVSGNISAASFSASSPNDGSAAVTLTWDFGDAAVTGSPVVIEYDARTANAAGNIDGTNLVNEVTLSYTDDGGPQTLTDSNDVLVIEPLLVIDKSTSNPTPALGETVTFTLEVSHDPASTADAHDLALEDEVPAGYTYVGGSLTHGSGAPPDQLLEAGAPNLSASWNSFPQGTTSVLTYQATLDADLSPGDELTNTAVLTWTSQSGPDINERDGGGGINDYRDSDAVTSTATNPDLRVTKDDGQTDYVPGTSQVYDIQVYNDGNGDVNGALVSDSIPSQVESWTWVCAEENGGAAGCDGAASTALNFGDYVDLPAGASIRYTVTAQILPSATGPLTNTVQISPPSGVEEPTPENNTASDTDARDSRADLSVSKDDGLTLIAPNSVLTYTVVVENNGPSDAIGVEIEDALPAEITAWDWVCSGATGGAAGCDGVSGSTTDFNDTVNLPASATLTYTVTANVSPAASGTLTNTVDVTAPAEVTDTDLTNNTAADTDAFPGHSKILSSTNQAFTATPDAAVGEILTYQVWLTVPPGEMTSLNLTDVMDRGLAFLDCESISANSPDLTTSVGDGFDAVCSNPAVSAVPSASPDPEDAGRQVVFNFGTLANSGSEAVDLVVSYRAAALDNLGNQSGISLDNQAVWAWSGGSLSDSAAQVTVREPDLEFSKSVSPRSAFPGQTVTFTLTVDHTGLSETPAYDVILTDIVPAGLTYVPGSLRHVSGQVPDTLDEASAPSLTVIWDELLNNGESSTISFDVTLDSTLRRGERVENSAALAWTSLPGDVSSPQSVYNTLSTERFYDPGSAVNVYGLEASAVIRVPALPDTGFAPRIKTVIPEQPAGLRYSALDNLQLEIPRLVLSLPIVSIPQDEEGWDLTWLWQQAGWLEGTAFPTWQGNTALTAHVYLANGAPGPFVNLDTLVYGDEIYLLAHGQKYIYQVRSQQLVPADDLSILSHRGRDWLTLFTCRGYSEYQEEYLWRQSVQAVLIQIEELE